MATHFLLHINAYNNNDWLKIVMLQHEAALTTNEKKKNIYTFTEIDIW
jgi:hypothetical protein